MLHQLICSDLNDLYDLGSSCLFVSFIYSFLSHLLDSTAFSRVKVERQTFTHEGQRLTAGNLEQYCGNNHVFTSNNPDNPPGQPYIIH